MSVPAWGLRTIAAIFCCVAVLAAQAQVRTITITADQDSRYKADGRPISILTLKAGEKIALQLLAHRAKSGDRDGAIHGFALLDKNGDKVPGWNLRLKEGIQEFQLTAPLEPGTYHVVCTVICSEGHEQMNMKVIVTS